MVTLVLSPINPEERLKNLKFVEVEAFQQRGRENAWISEVGHSICRIVM
jgi:hypothetical protein